MNIEIFTQLKNLKNTLDCETEGSSITLDDIKTKCLQALQFINGLRFQDNSAHVQLATRHAIQYLNQALTEVEWYKPVARRKSGYLKDICAPAHAGLEIILNLNY